MGLVELLMAMCRWLLGRKTLIMIESYAWGHITERWRARRGYVVRVCDGSKLRAYKKFGVYDDDMDLAHRFVESLRANYDRGILIVHDPRVARLAEGFMDDDVRRRAAIVVLQLPRGQVVPLSRLLRHAKYGRLTRLTSARLITVANASSYEEGRVEGDIAILRRRIRCGANP
ncbi:MAG: hypothetical protein DRJ67_01400 [Thermoprotei archaeon]|nr:MAG: hypothetical protein DRJ67_01400 [Thermoprotei archaeon]